MTNHFFVDEAWRYLGTKLVRKGEHVTTSHAKRLSSSSSWWLNQLIWKICSSNWIISPCRCEHQEYLKHLLVIILRGYSHSTNHASLQQWSCWIQRDSMQSMYHIGRCFTLPNCNLQKWGRWFLSHLKISVGVPLPFQQQWPPLSLGFHFHQRIPTYKHSQCHWEGESQPRYLWYTCHLLFRMRSIWQTPIHWTQGLRKFICHVLTYNCQPSQFLSTSFLLHRHLKLLGMFGWTS